MRLSHALRIVPGQSVAFVGAGGKTSAIQVLINELQGKSPVLATTTTKLGLAQNKLAEEHLILTNPERLEDIWTIFQDNDSVLVTGDQVPGEPKWGGLNLDVLRRLREITLDTVAIILIEADGARMKSIKAPAEHEPVIPDWIDLVVTMAGLDAVGQPFTSEYCHRAELAKMVLGVVGEVNIDLDHIARLLQSPKGGLKGVPPSSIVRALVRHPDHATGYVIARQMAIEMITADRFQSVSFGSLKLKSPVNETIARTTGVILAAGSSTRLEGTKQLLPFKGEPMIRHVVEAAVGGGLDPIIVVVGEGEEGIRQALEDFSISFIRNPNPELGQGSSLRVGVGGLDSTAESALFLLADMPLVSSELIQALIVRHRSTLSPIVVPFSAGRRGNPVLFDKTTFESLKQIEGDQGGRAIFSQFDIERVVWDDTIHFDVDTPEDLEELRKLE